MITQLNLYLPGQNLTNLADNVDYNRYQDFKGTITVNFGVSPAEVTIKQGTLIEVNGNLYTIDTADYTFTMDNAAHNYITFTDNPATDFGSAAAIGTYSAAKQGYYQAGNLIRTLPFYIDQTSEEVSRLMDEPLNNLRPRMKNWDRVFVNLSTTYGSNANHIIHFDQEVYDELGNWNNGTYTFTASEAGWYIISLNLTIEMPNDAAAKYPSCYIRVNTTPISGAQKVGYASVYTLTSFSVQAIYYLAVGDTIDFWFLAYNGYTYSIHKDDNSNAYITSSAYIMRTI